MRQTPSRWRILAGASILLGSLAFLDSFFEGPVATNVTPHVVSRLPTYHDIAEHVPSFDSVWSGGRWWGDEHDGMDVDDVVTEDDSVDAEGEGEGDGDGAPVLEDEPNTWEADPPVSVPIATANATSCSAGAFDSGRWIKLPKPRPAPTCRWYPELREAPRPLAQARGYEWQPGTDCTLVELSTIDRINHLIDHGGLMLVGDSTVRGHFFQLVCNLAGLEMVNVVGSQLKSSAPLLKRATLVLPASISPSTLRRAAFPPGFRPGQTPLVTYIRHDFVFSRAEMIKFLPSYGLATVARAFSRRVGTKENHVDPPAERGYFTEFFDPRNRYQAFVSTTGLHWGAINGDNGRTRATMLVRVIMERWAQLIRDKGQPGQRIFLRASAPYEQGCKAATKVPSERVEKPLAMGFVLPFNKEMQAVATAQSNMRWLGLERLSRLRADAHALRDCLHFPVGAGVVEAWTDFLFHELVSSVSPTAAP